MNALAAFEVLAYHVDVIEGAIVHREQRRIARAAGLEAAKLRPLQREGCALGRGLDHIGQAHAEAQELRHGGHLVEGRAVDAKCVDIG